MKIKKCFGSFCCCYIIFSCNNVYQMWRWKSCVLLKKTAFSKALEQIIFLCSRIGMIKAYSFWSVCVRALVSVCHKTSTLLIKWKSSGLEAPNFTGLLTTMRWTLVISRSLGQRSSSPWSWMLTTLHGYKVIHVPLWPKTTKQDCWPQ